MPRTLFPQRPYVHVIFLFLRDGGIPRFHMISSHVDTSNRVEDEEDRQRHEGRSPCHRSSPHVQLHGSNVHCASTIGHRRGARRCRGIANFEQSSGGNSHVVWRWRSFRGHTRCEHGTALLRLRGYPVGTHAPRCIRTDISSCNFKRLPIAFNRTCIHSDRPRAILV